MATIQERAWEKYPEVIKHHNLAQIDINEEKRRMYIEIAKEQKALDDAEKKKLIEKVIWLIETSYSDTNFWTHSELVEGISADLEKRADELSDMFD